MARRRRVQIDTGIFDTERHDAAVRRNLERFTRPPGRSPDEPEPEDAAPTVPGPEGVSGAGGAATGFARRAIDTRDFDEVEWDPALPYPEYYPTRTTDMNRPRTVAAGYDEHNRIMRVTFREGAVYEYLDVPRQSWDAFRRTPSPGRFVDDVLNQFYYRRVDLD